MGTITFCPPIAERCITAAADIKDVINKAPNEEVFGNNNNPTARSSATPTGSKNDERFINLKFVIISSDAKILPTELLTSAAETKTNNNQPRLDKFKYFFIKPF